jgi:hypothetical protein
MSALRLVQLVRQRAAAIAWPAFLMAGVLEVLVFAVVDPIDLHWFRGPRIDWSTQAIYTVSFLIFWVVTTATGVLTVLLMVEPRELNQDDPADSAR